MGKKNKPVDPAKAKLAEEAKKKREEEAAKAAKLKREDDHLAAKNKAKKEKLLAEAVEVTNTVGARRINLPKGAFLLLPGRNLVAPKTWGEIKETQDGKVLIDAKLISAKEKEVKKEE